MYHSITFGTKNTWTDWHLIPSSRPVFRPPPLKEKFIDIPGINGMLDLSTLFTGGEPVYGNRTGSFEFIVDNDFLSWDVAYSAIMNYLHGRNIQAFLEDDPDWTYQGRFAVNDWLSAKSNSIIVIDYNVQPYKQDLLNTIEDWEWDPFDFDTGVIQELATIAVNNTTITVIGRPKQIYLGITSSVIMNVVVNGATKALAVGLNVIPGLALVEGTNTLVFAGAGTISINYRGGSL